MTLDDSVIAGGGTAGLILASRLTEHPANTVLVPEAGKENTQEAGKYAADAHVIWGPATNWSYQPAPRPGLGGRTFMQPRGKVIGGSTDPASLSLPLDADGDTTAAPIMATERVAAPMKAAR